MTELGRLLRQAREQEQLGLRELARESGVSPGQLSRIESGAVEQPSVETLVRLANALERDAAALIVLAESPESLGGGRLHAARLRLVEAVEALDADQRQELQQEEAELRRQIEAAARLDAEFARIEAQLALGDAPDDPTERELERLAAERAELDATSAASVRAVAGRIFTHVRGREPESLGGVADWRLVPPRRAGPVKRAAFARRPLADVLADAGEPSHVVPPHAGPPHVVPPQPRDDRQLRQLQRAWTQLTPERRQRVVEFVEDQRRLSVHDDVSARRESAD